MKEVHVADPAELIWYQFQNTYSQNDKGQLTGLNLCGQELTDDQLQEWLTKDLSALESLNVSENQLTQITIPATATTLRHLNVSENISLTSLTLEAELPLLETLNVSRCNLSQFELPQGFDSLRILDLRKNNLQTVTLLGNCPKLEELHIGDNQLSEFSLPEGFAELLYLYLPDNQIETLRFQSPLPKLKTLHLRNNQLQALPDNFLALDKLETLYLHNNPLPDIRKEVIHTDERGNSLTTVRDFLLAAAAKGTQPNDRVKIIIVGNGRVGKTSMYRRLKGEPFNPLEKYTHGVQLGKLTKENLPKVDLPTLNANIWDFGGQEIFYATHQFFLSDDALYILAWTPEENVKTHRERDKEELPFNEEWKSPFYWLENIRLRGENSPILMVQTHSDCIRSEEGDDAYKRDPYRASCTNFSASEDLGLSDLQYLITQKLNNDVEVFGQSIPVVYDRVIELLENKKKEKPEITLSEFHAICREAQVPEGGENSLLLYLYKTGVAVYFGEDDIRRQEEVSPKTSNSTLKDSVFIDPDWLTEQVYKLINNKLEDRKGNIDMPYLRETYDFSDEKIEQFVELLQRFELIFEANEDDTISYIAPQYLPSHPHGDLKKARNRYLKKAELSYVFRFPKFMPDNVMINFLSRYGSFAEDHYWRNGIIITKHGHECMVELDKDDLRVYTVKGQDSSVLEREIFDAFTHLSRHANAHLSLNGQDFVDVSLLRNYYQKDFSDIPSLQGNPLLLHEFAFLLDENVRVHHPTAPKTTRTMRTSKIIKIALASSNELEADRKEFREFIAVENDRLVDKGIYLKIIQWEYFLETMSKTRLQDEYNKAMKGCDVLLTLFFTKVGKFTKEEFESAWKHFQEHDKPVIFTYFKNAQVNMADINEEDYMSLLSFKKQVKDLGHFPSHYTSMDDFKVQFRRQLDILLELWAEKDDPSSSSTRTIIQHAEKIYNIGKIDDANFS